jgi:hypothetical protein
MTKEIVLHSENRACTAMTKLEPAPHAEVYFVVHRA